MKALQFKRENGKLILLGEHVMENAKGDIWIIAKPEEYQGFLYSIKRIFGIN